MISKKKLFLQIIEKHKKKKKNTTQFIHSNKKIPSFNLLQAFAFFLCNLN